jgi:DHA3 family tetracycline resistance protein-like MFS transporter
LKRLNPSFVYLLFCGVMMFCRALHFTVASVYYATVVGLNPFELVSVGTTLMVVILLAEVPTGVVADVYSRRLSVIIGTALIGAGFALEGAVPSFTAVLAAQLIWGVGLTFTSGALEAWIADELGGQDAGPIYVRGGQAGQFGALLGIGGSVALASLRLSLPMLISGLALVAFAGLLALIMSERGFVPAPRGERASWQLALRTVREGAGAVRARPALLTIMGVTFFFAMASETFDRLWEVHFLGNFAFPNLGRLEPVVWFGIIDAGTRLLSIAGSEIARRRVDTSSHVAIVRALAAMTALLVASVIGFGLAGSFAVALGAYWLAALLRQVYGPIYTAWLNQNLESRTRATVNSLAGQVDAIGQIAGGPPFGLIATWFSTRAAMAASALALLPTLALYARAMRQPAPAEESAGALPEPGA